MKILIIYPTSSRKYRKGYMPPLVPALLAGMTPKQHDVTVVNDAVEDITPYLTVDFDLVAITAMTVQASRAYELAKLFRARKIPVIMGGFHTAVLKEDAMPHVDSVVVGECEDIWEDILVDAENGRLKEVYYGPEFDLQRQILPDFNAYQDLKRYEHIPWLKLPIMPIYTTRGCPMGCEFCSVTLIHGRKYRHRPIEHVMEEMDMLNYAEARFYFIIDDNITGDVGYSRELFKALKGRREQNINFFAQSSTDMLLKHPDLLPLIAEAGCSSMFIGVESLSQSTLDSVGKKHNHVEKYEELFKQMYSAGVIPFVSLIFGFDEDTPETFRQALEFHQRHDLMLSAWWLLSPAPGTPFCRKMEEEHRILGTSWSAYDGTKTLIKPKNFTMRELMTSYWDNYQKYYASVDEITSRVRAKYPAITEHNFLGALHVQKLARKQVMHRHHPFAMGSV